MRLLAIAIILLTVLNAKSEVPFYNFTPREYRLGIEPYYFITDSNYNENGNSQSFESGFDYSQYGFVLRGRYTASRAWSYFGNIKVAQVESENPNESKSTTEISGVNLGITNRFARYYFNFDPTIRIYIPFESYDENAVGTSSSEGILNLEVGVNATKLYAQYLLEAYLGYEYKSDDFASLIQYKLLGYFFWNRWALSAGILGHKPAGSDNNDDSARTSYILRNNGSSFIYNSKEPSRDDLMLQVGYVLSDNSRFFINSYKSIMGENASDYYQFNLGYEFRFQTEKKKKTFIEKPIEKEQDGFEFQDETTEPDFEEEIKSFNRPELQKKKNPPQKSDFNLDTTDKDFDRYDEGRKQMKRKKISSPSNKKKKRIRINF